MPPVDISTIASNLLIGFIGSILGAWASGRYVIWRTTEEAKHSLRSVVLGFGVHLQHSEGIGSQPMDPWSSRKEIALAAYHRYRALLMPWSRSKLDNAWESFQGTKPFGDTPFANAPMLPAIHGLKRVSAFLAFLQ